MQGWHQAVSWVQQHTCLLGPCSILDQVGLRCYPRELSGQLLQDTLPGVAGETQCERGWELRTVATPRRGLLDGGALEL